MNVTDYTTARQAGIVAFYRDDESLIRVYDLADDFKINRIKASGHLPYGERWFSTHSSMSLRADVRLALESFTGSKVLQSQIDFDI